jgi:hypothetical protein
MTLDERPKAPATAWTLDAAARIPERKDPASHATNRRVVREHHQRTIRFNEVGRSIPTNNARRKPGLAFTEASSDH